MLLRKMLLILPAMLLAGCSLGQDTTLLTGSVRPVVAPALVSDVTPEYAAAYLPAVAGQIEAVRQSSMQERITQSILYPAMGYGSGENQLRIEIAPPSTGSSYFMAPTLRELQLELRRTFPDVAMRITQIPGENLHGVFGYALGTSATKGNCIFAWQTARDISRSDGEGIRKFYHPRYAAKVRLRYCHKSMPEQSLVSLMQGLRIREVSKSTVEMMRFAEGTGVMARMVPVVNAGASGREPSDDEPKAGPVKTIAVHAAAPEAVDIPRAPVGKSPRIMLPVEVGGEKSAPVVPASSGKGPSAILAKAPTVPMPPQLRD